MTVRGELTVRGQALERLDLEMAVAAAQIVEDGGLEDHEAAVDPAFPDL